MIRLKKSTIPVKEVNSNIEQLSSSIEGLAGTLEKTDDDNATKAEMLAEIKAGAEEIKVASAVEELQI